MTTATETKPSVDIDFLRIEHDGRFPQNQFYQSEAFYPLYHGGVGIGKSIVLVVDFFEYAWDCPGSRQILTEPTYAMISDILLATIEDVYGPWEGESFTIVRQPPPEVHFPNGSQIWLRSTDTRPERLRGPNLARVGMDEITVGHQEEARNMLAARLRHPGLLHQLKATFTPRGRDWAYRDYFDKKLPGVETFFAETIDAERAGTLPVGFVERLAATYGGMDAPLARQELGGAFLRMAGPVFPQFSRDLHVRFLDTEPLLLKQRLGGVDFGGVSPTALEVGGLDAGGRAWIFDEWYKHEATIDQLIEAMAGFGSKYKIAEWICDPAGKAEMQKLHNAGFKVRPAAHGNSLKLRVQLLGARLNKRAGDMPGIYFSGACPNLITEVEGLMWKRVRIPGKAEEQMNDAFETGTPDHATDAVTNIVAEWDGTRPQRVRPAGPVRSYGAVV